MSPKRTLVNNSKYTLEQKIWTTIAVVLVILYILMQGYTDSLAIQGLIDLSLKIIPTPAR